MTDHHVMLVVGETSGDTLGAALMTSVREVLGDRVSFSGVGGPRMEAQGLSSIFPMTDIAVMGPREVIPRLPLILRRMSETTRHAVETQPDLVVIIDSPDFTHTVAKRIHKKAPEVPIANYVSPSVWAWRRGRAKAMATYLRKVLALLPFEPAFFRAEAGLDCEYVGHPAIEKIASPEEGAAFREEKGIEPDAPVLLALPGSRTNEVKRLIDLMGKTAAQVAARHKGLRVVIPVVPHVQGLVVEAVKDWPIEPVLAFGDDEKRGAFAAATAAIAASGTVSLELGLAGIPMVVAYKIDPIAAWSVSRFLKVPTVVLVNLILDRPAVKEFLQHNCKSEDLSAALIPLIGDTEERRRALLDLAEMGELMGVGGPSPSTRAANVVLEMLGEKPIA
ncbi:MAG: lipid-A-disaccharide synthase [Parvibaculum sp.]|jgi:lipid-A-disaccharide synthase|nr:lipid-A-disaccharide synthase [Parvibaculum sp.]|tara:strand:+ start:565 stop:1737 length:1173 start_codon:yes stop_codon:yes gene_type:complete